MDTYFSAFLLGLSLVTISLPPDLVLALPTSQSKRSPQVALEQIMVSNKIEQNWLSPSLTDRISLPKFQDLIDDVKEKAKQYLGDYKSVQFVEGENYRIMFERGVVSAKIRLAQDGRITNISILSPEIY